MKKTKNIPDWLQLYEIPALPKDRRDQLILAGKMYMDSAEFNRNSLVNLLLCQAQYLPISFWILQIGLTILGGAAVCLLGYWEVPLSYPLVALAVIIPLLVLLGVREISKSDLYDMWEIEQSCRCQLTRIVACRMFLIGLVDLFLVTGLLAIVSCYYQQSILEIILYGMVPFNISSTCYLHTVARNERGQLSYHLSACMACLAAVFLMVLRQKVLFEASSIVGWIIFYLASVILLGKTVRQYLEHEKKMGELAWNLQ